MSCPKTQHLVMAYLDDSRSSAVRDEMERHLAGCQRCREEVHRLQSIQAGLDHWQEQRVPHWDRGVPLFQSEHRQDSLRKHSWLWQWMPTAASLVMLVALLFNVGFYSDESGFRVVFGAASAAVDQEQLEEQLRQFTARQQQSQDQTLQQLMARLDEQQQSNNARLIQAVRDQARQLSAENFDLLYAYFEQQRQQDMESVQVSYQQLLDRDFETLRTMELLASAMQVQGQVR